MSNDHKPTLKDVKYTSHLLSYKCDECDSGFMEYSGTEDNKNFNHTCNSCGHEIVFEDDFFPRVVYVPEPSDKA